jgi:hypothetical protein
VADAKPQTKESEALREAMREVKEANEAINRQVELEKVRVKLDRISELLAVVQV